MMGIFVDNTAPLTTCILLFIKTLYSKLDDFMNYYELIDTAA